MRPTARSSDSVSRFGLLLASLGLVSASACNPPAKPIDPAALAADAALHAQDVVHNAGGGVGFASSDDSAAQKILRGLGDINGGVSGNAIKAMSAMSAPLPPPMMNTAPVTGMMGALTGDGAMPSMRTTEEKFDDAGEQLRAYLRDRVFVDSNLESSTDDAATYLLHPDPTCRSLPASGEPAGTVHPISMHCQDQLEKLQVRVVLRADGDGVQLEILVGPDRLQLSVFTIHSDLLAWQSDLARSKAAADFIDKTLGNDSPMGSEKVTALAGTVRLSLHKDGDRKVTFAAAVIESIHVAASNATGQPKVDFTTAKASPLLAVTADGPGKVIAITVGVGATDVRVPWKPQGSEPANLDAHVGIAAITGGVTFTGNQDTLRVTGLGVGQVVYDVRGTHVFDLNLNPQDNRRFDLAASLNQAGSPRFEITPKFDLSLAFHLAAIAGELKNPPPSQLLDETYGVLLTNATGASVFEAVKDNGAGFAGGLKVDDGSLSISSSKMADPVVVPAGKCLTGVKDPPAGAHPILGHLAVVDCP